MEKDVSLVNRLNDKDQTILEGMWREACLGGGSLRFKIASGCMRPLIEIGNVVRVSRVEPSKIQTGDIIAFQCAQKAVVHRVIGKIRAGEQLSFRHMGDAGASSRIIPAQNLIGIATVIEKEGGDIRLDSPSQVMSNRVFGWRLGLVDTLRRIQYRCIGRNFQKLLKPMWRLCRSLLLWR